VSGKLISEPPLLVLPSLAREVGLTDAIVLQQLHYASLRAPDGWVVRSAADWSRSLRGVVSTRTVERIFPKLIEAGWVEVKTQVGQPNGYRVTSDKLAEVVPPTSVGSPPPSRRGSVSREEEERERPSSKSSPKKVLSLEEEPEGFAGWLEHHVQTGAALGVSLSVPKHGTSYRSGLARTFAALSGEGYSLEEFKFASDGVLSDEFMREGGHVKPENVLRKEKIGGRVDAGRRWREARGPGGRGKYDHLD
jgi:hypothetical protein